MRKLIYLFIVSLVLLVGACEKEELNDLSDVFYVKHNGAEMPTYVYGNAEKKIFIIVLHGGPGASGLDYRTGAIKDLEKYYGVVYQDQRNAGQSSGSYRKNDLTVDVMVSDVLALVKVLRHKYGDDCKFVLYGHSWGGTLGTATLLKDQTPFSIWIESDGGHKLKGMARYQVELMDSIAHSQISMGNSERFWNKVLDKINDVDTANVTDRDLVMLNSLAFKAEDYLLKDDVLADYSGLSADIMQLLYQNNKITTSVNSVYSGLLLTGMQDIWNTIDYTPELNKITIPTLFLWGELDMVLPPELGRQAYNASGAGVKEFILYHKSAHSPQVNEYSDFAEDIHRFIEENM